MVRAASSCRRLEMLGVQRAGTYAEYVLVPAHCIAPHARRHDLRQAASTQTTFATAWHCLISRARARTRR